jgi:hypothetical protein
LYGGACATLDCLLIESDVHHECGLREEVIDSLEPATSLIRVSSGAGSAQEGRFDDG